MKNKEAREGISRRLREAVLASDMTYKQIREKAGLHYNAVSGYMSKEHRLPSVEALAALCGALGVSADWVLGLEGAGDDKEERNENSS